MIIFREKRGELVTSGDYLSARVREARGELSFRKFSEICDISSAYIQKIESGISRGKSFSITLDTLARLVHGGVKIDYDLLIGIIIDEIYTRHSYK